ncbi:MAG: hypothetical protein U0132_04945 [Gemmatimonadaceae bacterium]
MSHLRVTRVSLIASFVAALAPVIARAQDAAAAMPPTCTSSNVVRHVVISVVSNDTVIAGQRLPVRVNVPIPADLVALPEADGSFWVVTLADPARVDSLELQLRVAGLRSLRSGPVRAELRGGECMGRAAYSLARVWRVEVSSKPDNLEVEARIVADTALGSERLRTRFSSPDVPWSGRLLLKVFVSDGESFVQELQPARFRSGQIVLLTKHDIADRMCEQHDSCQNRFARMLHGLFANNAGLEELSFKMVIP